MIQAVYGTWKLVICFLFIFFKLMIFFPFILSWAEVHYGIYKGSYNVSNISYLDLPRPLLSFILLSPDSWHSFNKYDFCIYIHVYTFFCTIFILLPTFPATYSFHCFQHQPPFPIAGPIPVCSLIL
jgi:hypothetical protein